MNVIDRLPLRLAPLAVALALAACAQAPSNSADRYGAIRAGSLATTRS